MNKCRQLILQLHDFQNDKVLHAVEGLRANGWLADGSLEGIDLHFAHMQNANLSSANLKKVNLTMADLRWTDLSNIDLRGAHLNHADFFEADLNGTDLTRASLICANLQSTHNLNHKQLESLYALSGATMPDGSIYDGHFDLPGDTHERALRANSIRKGCNETDVKGLNSGLATELSHLSEACLILKLRCFDNRKVAAAVRELRKRGCLIDGSLNWLELRFAHLQGMELYAADFSYADLSLVNFQGADLSNAKLSHANLHQANFRDVDFYETNLHGAIMTNAILQGSRNWTYKQLAQLNKLCNAMMPDGSRYDGRFNLAGDLTDARGHGVELNNREAMADFYGVSREDYLAGQSWAVAHLSSIWSHAERIRSTNTLSVPSLRQNLENHGFVQR